MASLRVAFHLTEGVQGRVSQEEIELGKGIARRAGQDDLGHKASAVAVGVLVAHLLERDLVAGCDGANPACTQWLGTLGTTGA